MRGEVRIHVFVVQERGPVGGSGGLAGGQTAASATPRKWPPEPSSEQAVARWPDMERPIAWLGCKDHPDEFAVTWNGNLSMFTNTGRTHAGRATFRERANLGLQVSFAEGGPPARTALGAHYIGLRLSPDG